MNGVYGVGLMGLHSEVWKEWGILKIDIEMVCVTFL